MNKNKFTDEQIDRVLQEFHAGGSAKDVSHRHGISVQTLYRWKSKYGGLASGDLRRLNDLEEENRKLKQQLAEVTLDNQALKKMLAIVW